MALETRIMSASRARDYARMHQLQLDAMEGKITSVSLRGALSLIGTTVIGTMFAGPVGSLAGVADLMMQVADASNKNHLRSVLIGAREGFYEIASFLDGNSKYLEAEVQQVWVGLPYPNSGNKFVEGVQRNPSQGYRILRVKLSDGKWMGQ